MNTVILVRWNITGKIRIFKSIASLYKYHNEDLNVSKWTLYSRNLFEGYQNDIVYIKKYDIRK